MPKEAPEKQTVDPADKPSTAEDITGLETQDAPPLNVSGTVADMLSLRKKPEAKPAEKLDENEKAKEKKLDDVDQKLRDLLFKNKKKQSKDSPAEKDAEVEDAVEEEAVVPPKAPAKAVAKKAPAKDLAAEIRKRELELEQQRIELDRQRLEFEKSKQANQPKVKPVEDDLSLLSTDERYELEVFNVMAKLDPSKHGNLPSKFSDVAKATAQYKRQWEKDHPGQQFDPEDAEHDEFFSKHRVEYDRKDFKRAEHKLATEGDTDPKVEELSRANRELMARNRQKDLEPAIANSWARNLDGIIGSIGKEVQEVARQGREKLLEEFPVEGEQILMASEALYKISTEAFKLLEGDGLFEPDQNNREHARILDIIRNQERLIPAQPLEDQLDPDGRRFATWSQWASMSPSQQANHWHLGAEEVMDIVSRDLSSRIKYELDRVNKLLEARIRKSESKSGAEIKEKPQEKKSPVASPGSAGKTTVDISAKTAQPDIDRFTKTIRSALFKRSS